MQSKEIITAPKADAITSSDVFDSSSVCGALSFNIMKEIKLTQQGKNKGKFVALVDDEDYEYLNQFRWNVYYASKTYYTHMNICKEGRNTTIPMHRLIMNTPKGLEVDHIDHNGLNNQKYNLRNCTHADNQMNSVRDRKEIKYRGVYIRKLKKHIRYTARLRHNGIYYWLGQFHNPIDAAKSYDRKAKELFGEFASLNFK